MTLRLKTAKPFRTPQDGDPMLTTRLTLQDVAKAAEVFPATTPLPAPLHRQIDLNACHRPGVTVRVERIEGFNP